MVCPSIPTFMMNAYDTFGLTIDGFLVKGVNEFLDNWEINELLVEYYQSVDLIYILLGKSLTLK